MPTNSTTEGDLQKQPKLRVYSRRNNSRKVEVPVNSQPCQKFEPDPGIQFSTSEPEIVDLDIPIALRKGVRSCTQHPISNFVAYEHLSSSFRAFVTNLSGEEIPRTIQEALRVPKWKKDVIEEMQALEKMGHGNW